MNASALWPLHQESKMNKDREVVVCWFIFDGLLINCVSRSITLIILRHSFQHSIVCRYCTVAYRYSHIMQHGCSVEQTQAIPYSFTNRPPGPHKQLCRIVSLNICYQGGFNDCGGLGEMIKTINIVIMLLLARSECSGYCLVLGVTMISIICI